ASFGFSSRASLQSLVAFSTFSGIADSASFPASSYSFGDMFAPCYLVPCADCFGLGAFRRPHRSALAPHEALHGTHEGRVIVNVRLCSAPRTFFRRQSTS